MSEEKNYKIITEQKGKFTFITKDKKIYHWEFPATSSLEENHDILSKLHEEVQGALDRERQETKKRTETKEKTETKDGKPVEELSEEEYKKALENAEVIENEGK